MADRYASVFGPVLRVDPSAPEAFSHDEIQRIRGMRAEADLLRAGPAAWPERRRFQTVYPARPAWAFVDETDDPTAIVNGLRDTMS